MYFISLPGAVHHSQGTKVATGETQQHTTGPVDPIVENKVGHEDPLNIHRLIVAQQKEGDK